MIRLIAADMDGTLVNRSGELTERTVQAIRNAQDKGVTFAVCTGRIYQMARTELIRNGIRCSYLCNSGAQIFDEDGNMIRSIPLDRDTAMWVIAQFERWKVPMEIQTEDRYFVVMSRKDFLIKCYNRWRQGRLKGYIKRQLQFYRNKLLLKLTGEKAREGSPIGMMLPLHVKRAKDVYHHADQIYKISSSGISPKKVEEMKAFFQKSGRVTAVSSFKDNLEVTDIRAQKGMSLAWYADYLGVPKEEVMAIGDSDNDLSMIEMDFGYTVAMGNAMDCIREAAKYETLTNEEDGVAVFMEKYV